MLYNIYNIHIALTLLLNFIYISTRNTFIEYYIMLIV